MEQRDLIKDEIEQLGKVLGKLLAKLLGIEGGDDTQVRTQVVNQQLQDALDIDIHQLMTLDKSALTVYLLDKQLNADHLEQLSEYAKVLGQMSTGEEAQSCYQTALTLLDLAEETSQMISFERAHHKSRIEQLIKELSS